MSKIIYHTLRGFSLALLLYFVMAILTIITGIGTFCYPNCPLYTGKTIFDYVNFWIIFSIYLFTCYTLSVTWAKLVKGLNPNHRGS